MTQSDPIGPKCADLLCSPTMLAWGDVASRPSGSAGPEVQEASEVCVEERGQAPLPSKVASRGVLTSSIGAESAKSSIIFARSAYKSEYRNDSNSG